jgi:predicted metalloendopeptidase
MGDTIRGLDWMGPKTKAKALEKLATFNPKIGYPERWRDYSKVEIGRGSLWANVAAGRRWNVADDRAQVGKPVDRGRWGMTPPTSNAYYNPLLNEIVFPAGILQPPFFDQQVDDAINFGGIGVVIGHEYTHGFDDQGSKFDPAGNLENWWTDADRKAFDERTTCIAQQYDGYVTVPDPVNGDVHLNGRLTLGENTADNGGLRVAYAALQKALAGQPRQPIDGFTPEQRFFLGFANVWCQNATEAAARQLAQTDPHSAGRYRVIGAVSNAPEFAQAFGCKAGQPMVRENACRAW